MGVDYTKLLTGTFPGNALLVIQQSLRKKLCAAVLHSMASM